MGNSSVWLNFHVSKMNKINYYGSKEHLKVCIIAKFGREMLKIAENMASRNLPICYTFVLRAEICTTYTPKLVQISLHDTIVYKTTVM